MRQINNRAAALAACAALAILASCSNEDAPARSEAATARSTASTPPGARYTVVAESHLFGPGRWAMQAAGDPEAPLAVIDVPEGYQGRERYVWTHDELDLATSSGQILYGTPTRVLDDPCDVDRPSPRLGPTVQDLAAALTAQKRTTTTPPIPTELGGYRGLYLELTTPEGDDFKDCSTGGMLIFQAGPDFDRVLEVPATDRYWILDLGGRRVVVTAMTPARARSESITRVTDVAERVTFVKPSS